MRTTDLKHKTKIQRGEKHERKIKGPRQPAEEELRKGKTETYGECIINYEFQKMSFNLRKKRLDGGASVLSSQNCWADSS